MFYLYFLACISPCCWFVCNNTFFFSFFLLRNFLKAKIWIFFIRVRLWTVMLFSFCMRQINPKKANEKHIYSFLSFSYQIWKTSKMFTLTELFLLLRRFSINSQFCLCFFLLTCSFFFLVSRFIFMWIFFLEFWSQIKFHA